MFELDGLPDLIVHARLRLSSARDLEPGERIAGVVDLGALSYVERPDVDVVFSLLIGAHLQPVAGLTCRVLDQRTRVTPQQPLDIAVRLDRHTQLHLELENTTGAPLSFENVVMTIAGIPAAVTRNGFVPATPPALTTDIEAPVMASSLDGVTLAQEWRVVPGGTGGGTPGAPGSVWHPGEGAPDNAVGINGDYYYDTATGDIYHRAAGVYSVIGNIKGPSGEDADGGPLFVSTADAQAVNTAAPASLVTAGVGSMAIGANRLAVGSLLRLKARGLLSTKQLGAGTLRLDVGLGAQTVSTGNISAPANVSGMFWELEVEAVCRTDGSGGTFIAHGVFKTQIVATGQVYAWPLVMTQAAALNTTISNLVALSAQWSVPDAANDLRCQMLTLEVLD